MKEVGEHASPEPDRTRPGRLPFTRYGAKPTAIVDQKLPHSTEYAMLSIHRNIFMLIVKSPTEVRVGTPKE